MRKLLTSEDVYKNITRISLNYSYNNNEFEENYYEEQDLCTSFYVYLEYFHTYYIPFIISVGLIGNLLSCMVFLTTYLKMRSSSYYLAALAVADFGFLSALLIVHFSFKGVIEVYNREGWCQTFVYISSVCSTLSVWLIVAFTVERFIAVQYPLQRPHICTVSRAKIIVCILFLIALASHSYVFWIAGIINNQGTQECEMIPDYHDFMKIVNFIDTVVTLIGPVILIVTMNTMIARNLLFFRKRFQHGSLDDTYNNTTQNDLELLQQSQTHQSASSINRQGVSQQSQNSRSPTSRTSRLYHMEDQPRRIHLTAANMNLLSTKNQQNITKTLLVISSVFIALNLPSYLIRLTVYYVYAVWQKTPPAVLWCIQQFAMLLFYTNFSINFLLYAMCGVTFRRCLWQLIRNTLKALTKLCHVRSR